MHIMFVCTGNICRSPMGELLLTRYLRGTSIRVSSAGTKGLAMHAIDPSAKRIMDSIGIDSSGFRSRRLTRSMVQTADLVLCFEQEQRKSIVTLVPTAVRYTFLLGDFANMCEYCAQRGLIKGTTIQERLQSVIAQSSMVRPMLPDSQDIEDPHKKEFEKYHAAADATNAGIRRILTSMRKHYQVEHAPERRLVGSDGPRKSFV
jgi:protein-tyrosine phosphatase